PFGGAPGRAVIAAAPPLRRPPRIRRPGMSRQSAIGRPQAADPVGPPNHHAGVVPSDGAGPRFAGAHPGLLATGRGKRAPQWALSEGPGRVRPEREFARVVTPWHQCNNYYF